VEGRWTRAVRKKGRQYFPKIPFTSAKVRIKITGLIFGREKMEESKGKD